MMRKSPVRILLSDYTNVSAIPSLRGVFYRRNLLTRKETATLPAGARSDEFFLIYSAVAELVA
jgi:hypothetical protein